MVGFCVAQLKSENQTIQFEELQQKNMAEKKHLLHCYPYIHICPYFCLPISFFGPTFLPPLKESTQTARNALWKCVVFASRQVQVSNIQDAMQLLDLPLEAGTSVTKDVVGTEDYDWSTYSPLTVGLFTIGFPKKKAGYEPLISGGRRLGGVG